MPDAPNRGSDRRFCSARCRTAFHVAARRLGREIVESGMLTFDELKAWCAGGLLTLDGRLSISRKASTLSGHEVCPICDLQGHGPDHHAEP
jgi:hypothetical protein